MDWLWWLLHIFFDRIPWQVWVIVGGLIFVGLAVLWKTIGWRNVLLGLGAIIVALGAIKIRQDGYNAREAQDEADAKKARDQADKVRQAQEKKDEDPNHLRDPSDPHLRD